MSSYLIVIILVYAYSVLMWSIMAAVHINWGEKDSFAGVLMAVVLVSYGYANYDFFTSPGNYITEHGRQVNMYRVLALGVASHYLARGYFPRVKNWINRNLLSK